jgi:hypothetical protein
MGIFIQKIWERMARSEEVGNDREGEAFGNGLQSVGLSFSSASWT